MVLLVKKIIIEALFIKTPKIKLYKIIERGVHFRKKTNHESCCLKTDKTM